LTKKIIGSYLDRSVILSSYNDLFEDSAIKESSIYLILIDYEGFNWNNIDLFMDSEPLGIMIGGSGATDGFNVIISSLSSKNRGAYIMTRIAENNDMKSILQEFFQTFWPAEDRFDLWSSYHILNIGYDICLIETNVRDVIA